MGNIIEAKVKIRGTRPLFWHAFGPDALPLEKQERQGVAGNDPSEWRKTVLVTRDGQLFIRGNYAFGAMREAARYTKRGRASLMKPIAATLQVAEDRIFIDRWMPNFPNDREYNSEFENPPPQDPESPVYLDVRGVINPSTRGRNVRYRVAASPGWSAEFTLVFDKTIISREEMEAIAHDAGALVGVGSGRAIGMGRFELVSFAISE